MKALASALGCALILVACGGFLPQADTVRLEDGYRPGKQVDPCTDSDSCRDDYTAEAQRWADARGGGLVSVTFHQIVNDAGQIVLGTRSGGLTFIAVETFGDGHREAFYIGCGIGIYPHECFSRRRYFPIADPGVSPE
jgi:hypothetical protein